MSYIIVWRNSHREPHIDLDDHNFKTEFSYFESAKEYAEEIIAMQGPKDPHYFDYQIYEEVKS